MAKKPLPASPKPTVSRLTIWLAAIAATLVMVLLFMAFMWLDMQGYPSDSTQAGGYDGSKLSTTELLVFGLIIGGIILGPGILVALIILPILKKNKHK